MSVAAPQAEATFVEVHGPLEPRRAGRLAGNIVMLTKYRKGLRRQPAARRPHDPVRRERRREI